jgi:uncharacterized protein YbaA (DUF1428 family)
LCGAQFLAEAGAPARRGAAQTVWMEHGALSYVEAQADDVPDGELTSFPMAVKKEPGDTIVFSYVTYKSREHRDDVMRKVMADERLQPRHAEHASLYEAADLWRLPGVRGILKPGCSRFDRLICEENV